MDQISCSYSQYLGKCSVHSEESFHKSHEEPLGHLEHTTFGGLWKDFFVTINTP
jgi:hypothetical protein